jgi:hypothetical protein
MLSQALFPAGSPGALAVPHVKIPKAGCQTGLRFRQFPSSHAGSRAAFTAMLLAAFDISNVALRNSEANRTVTTAFKQKPFIILLL